MATVDLTSIRDRDGFVIYFGGEPNEVNTYTFANALVALSDALREINAQVNPGFSLELKLEALSEGSFKARVRELPTTIKGVLKYGANQMVMPILVAFVYSHLDPSKPTITVNADEVIVQTGRDRVIIPRAAYNSAQALPNKAKVASQIAKTVEAVANDPKVASLGILTSAGDAEAPALLIPRDQFDAIRDAAVSGGPKTRTIPQEATVHILKAVLGKADRKWEFVWNGVKITATIADPAFLADFIARKYLIGTGDSLEVTLMIDQVWDDDSKVWLNTAYSVHFVKKFIAGASPQRLALDGN
jgi:hypothetical protein